MAEGGGCCERPDAETQKSELGALMRTTLQRGAQWYLIDSRWFKQWKKYVGFDSWDMYSVGEHNLFPGPIDNSGLFSDPESQTLKEHLIDELDYVLVPAEAWNKLLNWYGCVEGQQPIVRKVVEHGLFVKHCKVEVYLLELKLCENSDPTNVLSCHFSKSDTIATIEKEMRKLFNIPVDRETRLWNKYMSNTYEQLSKLDNTVQDAGLYQGQVLVIEPQNEDGTWPRQTLQSKSSTAPSRNFTTSQTSSASPYSSVSASPISNGDSTNTSGMHSSGVSRGGSGFSASYNCQESPSTHVQPGLCGLGNLGNTCFMNSALQCLSNTAPLTDYFLKDEYEAEINRDNPLGMKGEIAEAYAELIKQMWSGRDAHVAPRMFKTQVGRFAPQFSGYQQQDSQELLAFLLDGLHEDLNRVKKKPYLELKDANGRPDAVVAKEAWENHRLRNDSVIVDTFHGLFKSTLVCPECAKVSVTFDPFCYLTLPLPLKKDRVMEIFLVPADPRCRPTQYRVIVPLMGAVSDLCEALSRLSGIAAENMVVTDVYNHRFHKIFQMDEGLNHIMPRDDIFVYEVCSTSTDGSECVTLPVYFRERKSRPSSTSTGAVLYGQPLLVSVPKYKLTLESLYQAVCERISRYIKQPLPDESGSSPLELGACSGSRGSCEGEDEEEMEHQEEGREQLSETEDSGEDELGSDHGETTQKKLKGRPCPKRLFTFCLVNSYGTADLNSLAADGKLLKLNSRSTLAIDWDSETRSRYYDEQESETYEKHVSMLQPQKKKKTAVALRDCIELFTTMETLGEHDPWYCPNCKKHQQATKKFDLWSLPKILVVHLKRFSYNRYWRDKLDTVVEFPVRALNMSEFVCDLSARPYVYDLIAVSNHYGAMGVGHYTAYAKNKLNGKWYYFDDSSVSLASEDQIVTKAAYVLFYQRRDDELYKTTSLSFPGSFDGGTRPGSLHQGMGDDETCSMDTN
ncbi:ubiquitin carboxyl-terminal hydrolase 4 isoform X1 [Neophocaena asiaeorientalis asiaeorientalis]|uniref:Ubiquitin carboxyl-terminal hydrolase n=2 Tax=Neophocaena asiaeorientalis asiaeorientalis TaxID=1706337 RepID=A0A341AU05_NEOAA|nr:ubiquitin carboxyl-terminal hydrolase 4 isoform X1 [Neophocaena asiaeorientalis asiaeorientalis]